jgi:hypothetical protein
VDLLKKKEKDKKDKTIIEKKIEKKREREEEERGRGESNREIRRKYIKITCAQSNIDFFLFVKSDCSSIILPMTRCAASVSSLQILFRLSMCKIKYKKKENIKLYRHLMLYV